MSKVLVIIPTYNERENIEKLCRKILTINQNYSILVIDDNSPDKTAQIVLNLKKQYPALFLLQRSKKLGLGSAYKEGFAWAQKYNFNQVVTMDGDFSHDPCFIPHLINLAQSNDLVIGSRYVRGGKIIGFNIWRRFLSKSANLFVRTIFRLKVSDATSGFRCYGEKLIQNLPWQKFQCENYAFWLKPSFMLKDWGQKLPNCPSPLLIGAGASVN